MWCWTTAHNIRICISKCCIQNNEQKTFCVHINQIISAKKHLNCWVLFVWKRVTHLTLTHTHTHTHRPAPCCTNANDQLQIKLVVRPCQILFTCVERIHVVCQANPIIAKTHQILSPDFCLFVWSSNRNVCVRFCVQINEIKRARTHAHTKSKTVSRHLSAAIELYHYIISDPFIWIFGPVTVQNKLFQLI